MTGGRKYGSVCLVVALAAVVVGILYYFSTLCGARQRGFPDPGGVWTV